MAKILNCFTVLFCFNLFITFPLKTPIFFCTEICFYITYIIINNIKVEMIIQRFLRFSLNLTQRFKLRIVQPQPDKNKKEVVNNKLKFYE